MKNTYKIISARKIISYILSILLVIFLSISVLVINVESTIFSKQNIKNHVIKTSYIDNLYNIILDNCNNYNMQSGFSEDLLESVITKVQVEKDVNLLLDAIFEGKPINVNTSEITKNLDSKIQAYIDENNYSVNEETKKSIEEYKDRIEKTYVNGIVYSKDVVKNIVKYYGIAKRILTILSVVFVILSLVFMLIIFLLNKAALGISLLSVGAVLIFISCYSGTNIAVNNILLLNRSFSDLLISVINNFLHNMIFIGVTFGILGVAVILFTEIKTKIDINRQKTT